MNSNSIELETTHLKSSEDPPVIVIRNPKRTRTRKIQICLKKIFYICNWIGSYNIKFALNDLIAGITLGLTIIPESIACALLADLPSQYGLYSSVVGPFVYLIFGTIPKVLIGPTSLVALVTVQFTMGKPIEFAFLLTFLAGIVEILMGILRLGFIFDFISMPVIKAFSSATAILVIESQIKVMLGIKYLVPGFVNSLQTLYFRIEESNAGDAILGVSSIIFLLCLQHIKKLSFNKSSSYGRFLNTFVCYLSLSRNALVVLITSIVAFFWVIKINENVPFRLSESVVPGLPQIAWPKFHITSNNQTYTFVEICSELGLGILVVPLVAVLTNISIAKSLTPKGLVNASQELFTVGLCNVLGSTIQSMPTCGAFTRAAISGASGIKTSVAGIYSGILVILVLSLLTPYFIYIPQSALAAILMCAIVSLIDFKLPIRLWSESKRDFFTWISCFSVCIFFGVEVGLFFGIAVTSAHLLYIWARPQTTVKIEQMEDMQYIKVVPSNGMYFPGIDYLRERIIRACIAADFKIPVVIDCRKITGLDYTAAQGLSKLANDLDDDNDRTQALILFNMSLPFQKLIDTGNNLVFCETDEKLKEILIQESLRNGIISLKDHVRASIDLGYKIHP